MTYLHGHFTFWTNPRARVQLSVRCVLVSLLVIGCSARMCASQLVIPETHMEYDELLLIIKCSNEVIKRLLHFDKVKQQKILKEMRKLSNDGEGELYQKLIVAHLHQVEPKFLETFVTIVADLVQGISGCRPKIVATMAQVDPEELEEIASSIKEILDGVDGVLNKEPVMLLICSTISMGLWKKIAKQLTAVEHPVAKVKMIELLLELDCADWDRFVCAYTRIANEVGADESHENALKVLEALRVVAKNLWERFGTVGSVCARSMKSNACKADIFLRISGISPQAWNSFLTCFVSLKKAVDKTPHYTEAELVRVVYAVPIDGQANPKHWAQFVEATQSIQAFFDDPSHKSRIIEAMREWQLRECLDFCDVVIPLIKEIENEGERFSILAALLNISPPFRQKIATIVLKHFKGSDQGRYRALCMVAMPSVAQSDFTKLDQFACVTSKLIPAIEAGYYKQNVFLSLAAIDAEHWNSFLQETPEAIKGSVNFLLYTDNAFNVALLVMKSMNLSRHDEVLKEAHSVVESSIESHKFFGQRLEFWAQIVVSHDFLGLSQDDELFKKGLAFCLVAIKSDNPKDPFCVYQKLLAERKIALKYNWIEPISEPFGRYSIALVPKAFKQLQEAQVTFGDLPKHSPLFLRDMTASLKKRIKNEPELQNYVQETTGKSLEILLAGSLGSSYLEDLLRQEGEHHEYVPLLAAKFKAIIAYIETLSDERVDILSRQEEAFIHMLESIQNCGIGKDDGINKYYANALPNKNKLTAADASKIPPVLVTGVINAIEGLCLCSTPFMKSLGVVEGSYQQAFGVHHETYIKNLLGDVMPLNKRLIFDKYTEGLCEPLLKVSKQTAMEILFNHLRPSYVVSVVRTTMNEALTDEDSDVFMRLQGILDDCAIESADAWQIKDDLYTITKIGTIHLLAKLGVLENKNSPVAKTLLNLGEEEELIEEEEFHRLEFADLEFADNGHEELIIKKEVEAHYYHDGRSRQLARLALFTLMIGGVSAIMYYRYTKDPELQKRWRNMSDERMAMLLGLPVFAALLYVKSFS